MILSSQAGDLTWPADSIHAYPNIWIALSDGVTH